MLMLLLVDCCPTSELSSDEHALSSTKKFNRNFFFKFYNFLVNFFMNLLGTHNISNRVFLFPFSSLPAC